VARKNENYSKVSKEKYKAQLLLQTLQKVYYRPDVEHKLYNTINREHEIKNSI